MRMITGAADTPHLIKYLNMSIQFLELLLSVAVNALLEPQLAPQKIPIFTHFHELVPNSILVLQLGVHTTKQSAELILFNRRKDTLNNQGAIR